MKVLHIIGADLSKKTIDFATTKSEHCKVTNDPAGYHQLLLWMKKQKINIAETMIVMEHTGHYSYRLEKFLHQHQIIFTKVSAYTIKHSMGLVRGKNDKIDAIRIAQYGAEKLEHLVPESPVDKALERLNLLHVTRDRLVRNRAAMITAVKDLKDNCDLPKQDMLISSQMKLIRAFDREIETLDAAIATIMESEQRLKRNNELLQSVTGVGNVISAAVIIKTHNFIKFVDPRKFACHCGTAPFEHTSGSSIRGRTRISKLADHDMKRLLDLAAKSAIQYDKELRRYYLRRIAAGKSKKSTRNIVRNKILLRMFAVIKRQSPFIKDYLQTV